jgi:DNA polymerase-1
MGRKIIVLDFEFNRTKEPIMNLVCCSLSGTGVPEKTYWLYHDKEEWKKLAKDLLHFHNEDYTFVAYNAIAEARSMLALQSVFPSLKVKELRFIDLFVEYRCLTNHNHLLQYGKQLVDGKVKMTFAPKPKWERTAEDKLGGFSATHSLSEACYKLLGKIIDSEEKEAVRDIIISNDSFYIEKNQERIMDYCASDIKYLTPMLIKVVNTYKELLPKSATARLYEEMLLRGHYANLTAHMEEAGYPVDVKAMRNFSDQVPAILFQTQREINELFPLTPPFRFNKKDFCYSMDTKAVKEYIRTLPPEWVKGWEQTDGKDLSLSLDAFKKYFDYRHDYPKHLLGAQMVRYLTLKQNLNGFSSKSDSKKKTIWDYVGSDGRVRPYFNIYKAQSSRSQPPATCFLFLKSAWMRVMCAPPKGKIISGIDYGSQEFLISALNSGDKNMIDSYASGDVYLAFAKLTGAVPKDGTREMYEKQRDQAKPVVLAMSFLMSKYGLSAKLTNDLMREVDEEEAQEYIDQFYEVYEKLQEYQGECGEFYDENNYLKLPCGWTMFGDNANFRSVANFSVQGTAASIMRKAVEFAFDAGLNVIMTLHDAVYIEHDCDDFDSIDVLLDCMKRAFCFYFEGELKEKAALIRMDVGTWGPDMPPHYEDEKGKLKFHEKTTPKGKKITVMGKYIDKRGYNEYKKFKQYFEDREEDLI